MAKFNLPQEILLHQCCTVCGNPLSVGPVKVTSVGEVICGRSRCRGAVQGHTQDSIYNIIAAACTFKCVYHDSGCDKMLAFNEAKEHEKTCNMVKDYCCSFCFYIGNRYECIYHVKKMHSIDNVKEGANINKYIDALLKMSALEVRQVIGNIPKLFLPICQNCKYKIKTRMNIYFCPELHMACDKCVAKKCTQCASICSWNKNSVLDKILLECEWEGCSEKCNVFEYLWHKQTCILRLYKCPDPGCGYVSCLNEMIKHWHIFPTLVETKSIVLTQNYIHSYWLPPCCREIIEVTYDLTPNGKATVTVNQGSAIIPVNYRLTICNYSGIEQYRRDEISHNLYQRNIISPYYKQGYVKCEVI